MDRRVVLGSLGMSPLLASAAMAQTPQPSGPSVPVASNLNQIRNSGVLRLAVIPGQEPHFHKDLMSGEWTGTGPSMGRDLARMLGVKLETHESTWSNVILDVQSNRVDLAFGINPTGERALAVDFSVPLYNNAYVIISANGLPKPKTWEEINRPDAKVGVVIGTSYAVLAKRYLPKATVTSFTSREESLLSITARHVDYALDGAILAIKSIKTNPNIGQLSLPEPTVALPSCAVMRIDADKRLRDIMAVWAEYNRSVSQTREWVIEGYKAAGVSPDDVPAAVTF